MFAISIKFTAKITQASHDLQFSFPVTLRGIVAFINGRSFHSEKFHFYFIDKLQINSMHVRVVCVAVAIESNSFMEMNSMKLFWRHLLAIAT